MWILPKQLHTSPFVPDTEALISDLNEQSQACAQSLLVRSKPSPARTWSLKWKRDSWTQLLSGRILKPSHGPSFTAAWTSSLSDIHASRFQPPANASAPKTQDTSGRLSQPELLQCDQVFVSLKTSRDISALGFPTCCKTWQEWVTERRGAWRQRVNAARLTRGSGSLSWPTIRASEYKDVGPVGSKSHDHMLGKHYLCAVVTQDAANWSTPESHPRTHTPRNVGAGTYRGKEPLANQVAELHGQAAPASSSSLGSRQGLWPTASVPNGGQTTSGRADKDTKKQVRLEHAVRQELWLTPRANEPTGDSTFVTRNGDRGQHCSPSLTIQVEKTAQWGTPAANDANKQNVMCEVNSKQAGLPKSVGLELQRPWMTPNARDWKGAHGEHFGDRARTQSLNNQMEAIGNKGAKLNPRWVETLMGLPIGWTMPSCTSPQTIAPTSCDFSAMELCLPPQSELSEFSLAS